MALARLQARRDTASNWSSNNPTLADGELGYDTTNKIIKIGDGATAWNSLTTTFAMAAGTLAQFAATSSAQLRTLLSDETGTGAAVFASGPTLLSPTFVPIGGAGNTAQFLLQNQNGQLWVVTNNSGGAFAFYDDTNAKTPFAIQPNSPTNSLIVGTGGVSIGAQLDMTSHQIVAVTDPTTAQHAATKNYVDTTKVRVGTTASSATPTIDMALYEQYNITALAAAITSWTISNGVDGRKLVIRIKDNATARALAFGGSFRFVGATAPTTTVISKTLYLGGIWNGADSKLDVVAVAQEA